MKPAEGNKIVAFDFFCGCGGTSRGFQKAGMEIGFALDLDADAKETYVNNFPDTVFCEKSISDLKASDIEPVLELHKGSYKLFCGCAPCQPFTKQNTTTAKLDPRTNLLFYFGEVVKKYKPDFVFVENVPGLQKLPKAQNGPFPDFKNLLESLGYSFTFGVVAAQDYGAPQLRRRFVLLASLHGEIKIPDSTHGSDKEAYKTVREAIGDMPPITSGEEYRGKELQNHRAAKLSALNKLRMEATTPDGGGRISWPLSLWPKCYTQKNSKGEVHTGHTDCYGRLWWDKPATGLTTRCISYSNGRFGHPEQHRALSVREAARLQGFDDSFSFSGSLNSMARQIGNAVPVDLAAAMGKQFVQHAKKSSNGKV